MKTKQEYTDYLRDILDSVEKIEEFTRGMDFEQFSEDSKTIFAVTRALEVMGEATKNIPESIRGKYPTLPWKEMAGMRDKLIHEYFGVKLQVIWETITKDVPPVKPMVSRILEEAEK